MTGERGRGIPHVLHAIGISELDTGRSAPDQEQGTTHFKPGVLSQRDHLVDQTQPVLGTTGHDQPKRLVVADHAHRVGRCDTAGVLRTLRKVGIRLLASPTAVLVPAPDHSLNLRRRLPRFHRDLST